MKKKLFLFVSLFFMSAMLEYMYVRYVYVMFEYAGFDFSPNYLKAFESKILLLSISLLLPTKVTKPSDILVLWFLIFPIIPILSLYWLTDESRIFTFFIFFSIVILIIVKNYRVIKINTLKSNLYFTFFISLLFSAIGIGWFIISGAIKSFNLNLLNVYFFRREVEDLLSYGIMGYISVWTYKVFSIYLLAFSFLKKQKILLLFFVLLQIFYFGITSHRSVLFFPLLIFGLFIIFRQNNLSHKIFFYMSGLLLFLMFAFLIYNNDLIISLGIRRSFFVNAINHYNYYNIFSQEGFLYMSNSILSPFLSYPYDREPFFIVGEKLGDANMRANVGFLGSSYMHFGFTGMILFSITTAFLMNLVDSISKKNKIPNWFAASLVIIPFNSLFTTSELPTTLLTHGLVLSIILLWFSNFSSLKHLNGRQQ